MGENIDHLVLQTAKAQAIHTFFVFFFFSQNSRVGFLRCVFFYEISDAVLPVYVTSARSQRETLCSKACPYLVPGTRYTTERGLPSRGGALLLPELPYARS